jgi:hypothetical protein
MREGNWARLVSAGWICVLILSRVLGWCDTNTSLLPTGTGAVLTRSNLVFEVPTNLPSFSLRFDVGFASDETVGSGEFFDSFSVTLRDSARTFASPLVTLDLFGPLWTPGSPGDPTAAPPLLYEPASIEAVFSNQFRLRYAFTVVAELPLTLLGHSGLLALSLFDNQDAEGSLGYVRNLAIGPSLTLPLVVESSASASGPFAAEDSARIDRVLQAIRLPGGGAARFYRLRSAAPSRITRMRMVGSRLTFDYQADPIAISLALWTADAKPGPYRVVAAAQVDPTNRTVRVPSALVGPFLQLRGNVAAAIVATRTEGADLVLTFQYAEPVPVLESSAQAQGPFAPEPGVMGDQGAGQLSLPRGGQTRFYRLRSDTPLAIRQLERKGEDLILHYDLP